ncbi:TPA: LOW QUALITY PROTEIN: hypothetical protein N0F65_009620 [Lagenidium giganteum]|uniref:CCHC-type domain-containing protein n=1 Tax=Lagenidium giganteum TaxID=4803 RepID=A0AAV2YVK4_9STRA|nr:TPA: LOW QUALITY PROTEIN: hypothetical protein N0F65_009620 [Lagenidium giganteum]
MMGKRKARDQDPDWSESSEDVTKHRGKLNQLRLSLWQSILKSDRLVNLIRNEIPDARDHFARNAIQFVTDHARRRLEQLMELISLTPDFKIRQLTKLRNPKRRPPPAETEQTPAMEHPTAAQAASFAEQYAEQQRHFAEQFAQQQQAFAAQQQAARQAETSQGNMFEQFMYHLQLQNQLYQDQVNRQMNEANQRFERLLSLQGKSIKHGDPPTYFGKLTDLRVLPKQARPMEEDSSTFVTLIPNNLGKTVLNWYREFSAQCVAASVHKTWQRFITQLRARFRPKDVEPKSQFPSEEKRLYFQSGLRQETARKLKEESASTLEEAFAHFANEPPKKPNDRHPPKKSDKPGKKPKSDKDKSQNDWKKSATCHKCGKKGHFAPDCKSQERTETNNYISGSFYASLKVMATAFSSATNSREVSIFIDNGCSLNGISEELARDLNFTVREGPTGMITVDLGFGQSVRQPKKIVEMSLNIPGFPILIGPFLVMPIPQNNDVILVRQVTSGSCNVQTSGHAVMLVVVADVVNRLNERSSTTTNMLDIKFGVTELISEKAFRKELLRGNSEHVFLINPHASEKAERFKRQGWEALESNPAYEALLGEIGGVSAAHPTRGHLGQDNPLGVAFADTTPPDSEAACPALRMVQNDAQAVVDDIDILEVAVSELLKSE